MKAMDRKGYHKSLESLGSNGCASEAMQCQPAPCCFSRVSLSRLLQCHPSTYNAEAVPNQVIVAVSSGKTRSDRDLYETLSSPDCHETAAHWCPHSNGTCVFGFLGWWDTAPGDSSMSRPPASSTSGSLQDESEPQIEVQEDQADCWPPWKSWNGHES